MSLLPPVHAALAAAGAVTAIVGTTPTRVYRHGEAPQDTTRPYCTWTLVSGTPENTLSEPPLVDRDTVQIDCWHASDAGVVALAVAVRDAIEPHAYLVQTLIDDRDPATKLYRVALQFDWFVPR